MIPLPILNQLILTNKTLHFLSIHTDNAGEGDTSAVQAHSPVRGAGAINLLFYPPTDPQPLDARTHPADGLPSHVVQHFRTRRLHHHN